MTGEMDNLSKSIFCQKGAAQGCRSWHVGSTSGAVLTEGCMVWGPEGINKRMATKLVFEVGLQG